MFVHNKYFPPSPPFINATAEVNLNWRHHENAFDDFNVQYLLPHAQSTRGPKIAVADVNGDGHDDIYACNGKGRAGSLLLQQRSGNFQASDTSVFNADRNCEDVDAVFLMQMEMESRTCT